MLYYYNMPTLISLSFFLYLRFLSCSFFLLFFFHFKYSIVQIYSTSSYSIIALKLSQLLYFKKIELILENFQFISTVKWFNLNAIFVNKASSDSYTVCSETKFAISVVKYQMKGSQADNTENLLLSSYQKN